MDLAIHVQMKRRVGADARFYLNFGNNEPQCDNYVNYALIGGVLGAKQLRRLG